MSLLADRYNRIYTENKVTYGNGQATQVVRDILRYIKSGTVLELGAGEGRNAIFLAEKGFDVTAQDLSRVGITKLNKLATKKGLRIKTEVGDIRAFDLQENFDVIVSTFVFHHFTREAALETIAKLKVHTVPGGAHAITTFTTEGDFYKKDPQTKNFFPETNELRDLYAGWEILEYSEEVGDAFAKNEDGTPKQNTTASILARKPLAE